MWGEVAFLELKIMSPALPSQVLGLCGYIPLPLCCGKGFVPDFDPGELRRGRGQKDRWHVEVYAELCPGSCLSILTALLFSFLSPAHGAQEISLLLVSRVSLLCDFSCLVE